MSQQPGSRRKFLKSVSAFSALTALGGCQTSLIRTGGGGLQISTFRADVTPDLGTPIYSSYKPLETVEHPLLAKGIILQDRRERYVLCAVDWCELCNSTYEVFRKRIAEAAKTDVSHVAVQTVHPHTAPMADGDASRLIETVNDPPTHPTAESFEKGAEPIAAAVSDSLKDFVPFDRIGVGQAKVERVAGNRRIITADGKMVTRMSSCQDPAVRALPEGLIDPYVKTITFSRGHQPLVRMHYYATHPQSFYGDPRATYDFPGIAREELQTKENIFQVYFTGCGGDIAAGKYNDGKPPARAELAQRLLAGMEASIAATTYTPVETLSWRTHPVTFTTRNDTGYTEPECFAKMADTSQSTNVRYTAAQVQVWRNRAHRPIEFTALQLGNVHILHLPGEPMVEFQLFAQRVRRDAFVTVAGYGDCGTAYICTERSFPEGGYEPSASHLVPESEILVRDAIRRLLDVA
ncbi:MAG TPA: hypothetical protein PLY86_15140 [bacterium]|nr:hypothetical protein [bacterium]